MSKIDKHRTVPFSVKTLSEEGVFEGYAAVFGNKDSEGDIIVKGAFKRTIIAKQSHWPILWQHDYRVPVGGNITAEEDEHGLKIMGKLFLNMPNGNAAYEWMKNALAISLPVGLSIGFRIIDKAMENGIRYIKEIALVEYSIVTFPANEEAQATAVKAVGFQDLKLAAVKTPWNATSAVDRIWDWSGGDANIDWKKFGKFFLIYDAENLENKDSYGLPIADIVDDEPKIIPAALIAAAKSLPGVDIPDLETPRIHIEKYYKKLKLVSPFKGKPVVRVVNAVKAINFVEALQTEMEEAALRELRWTIESAKYDAVCSVEEDEAMTLQQKVAAIGTIFDQYGKAMTAWYAKFLGIQPDNTTDDDDDEAMGGEAKTGAAVSASTRKILSAACEMHDKAYNLHKEANRLHAKGTALLSPLLESDKSQSSQTDPDRSQNDPPTPDDRREQATRREEKEALDRLLGKIRL